MCPPLGWVQHMHMQWASDEVGGGQGRCPPLVGLHGEPAWCQSGQPHPPALPAPTGSSSWDLCSQGDPPRSSCGFEARTNHS